MLVVVKGEGVRLRKLGLSGDSCASFGASKPLYDSCQILQDLVGFYRVRRLGSVHAYDFPVDSGDFSCLPTARAGSSFTSCARCLYCVPSHIYG